MCQRLCTHTHTEAHTPSNGQKGREKSEAEEGRKREQTLLLLTVSSLCIAQPLFCFSFLPLPAVSIQCDRNFHQCSLSIKQTHDTTFSSVLFCPFLLVLFAVVCLCGQWGRLARQNFLYTTLRRDQKNDLFFIHKMSP